MSNFYLFLHTNSTSLGFRGDSFWSGFYVDRVKYDVSEENLELFEKELIKINDTMEIPFEDIKVCRYFLIFNQFYTFSSQFHLATVCQTRSTELRAFDTAPITYFQFECLSKQCRISVNILSKLLKGRRWIFGV